MKAHNRQVETPYPVTGYLHPHYARALSEFGSPYELHHCGGWVLRRPIKGFSRFDAMGCYPLFCCRDWSQLHADLEDAASDLVSISLVTDPFGKFNLAYLSECFKDLVLPFKRHFVINLNKPVTEIVSKHHTRYASSALRKLEIEKCEDPNQFLNDWSSMYANLIERHHILGIRAFSKSIFRRQLDIPGMVAFRAKYKGNSVGMLLWYVQGNIGYYHLGASTDLGYELRASFGLFWAAIEYFSRKGLACLDLGAGAGIRENSSDGLSRFKRGWSTGSLTAYFCGRIFDRSMYEKILFQQGNKATDYFPAYRPGEFV